MNYPSPARGLEDHGSLGHPLAEQLERLQEALRLGLKKKVKLYDVYVERAS